MEKIVKPTHYSVKELEIFIDCPLKWYILKREDRLYKPKEEEIKKAATFFLARQMGDIKCRPSRIFKTIDESLFVKNEYKKVKKQIIEFKKIFEVELLDIRCVELPFKIILKNNVIIDGNIDVVRNTPYGPDIIIYNFDEEPDVDELTTNPYYLIYVMGFQKIFKKDIHRLNIYNFPNNELIDISRSTPKMLKQIDILKDNVSNMRNLDFNPKQSLKCNECPIKSMCTNDYRKIEKEIEKYKNEQ